MHRSGKSLKQVIERVKVISEKEKEREFEYEFAFILQRLKLGRLAFYIWSLKEKEIYR